MTADIIERPRIHWPDQDQRFFGHGAVRSIPLKFASPPPQEKVTAPYSERHEKVTAPSVKTGVIGRPRRESLGACPKSEDGEHHLVSKSHQVKCTKCFRHIFKTLLPAGTKLHSKPVLGPIVISDLKKAAQPCIDDRPHKWTRNGWFYGKPRAICSRCQLGAQRLATAEELLEHSTERLAEHPVQMVQRSVPSEMPLIKNVGQIRVNVQDVTEVGLACNLHGVDECNCPAYLIVMGENDRRLEADIEATA